MRRPMPRHKAVGPCRLFGTSRRVDGGRRSKSAVDVENLKKANRSISVCQVFPVPTVMNTNILTAGEILKRTNESMKQRARLCFENPHFANEPAGLACSLSSHQIPDVLDTPPCNWTQLRSPVGYRFCRMGGSLATQDQLRPQHNT